LEAGVVIHRVPRAARIVDQPSGDVRIAFVGAVREEVDVTPEALNRAVDSLDDLRIVRDCRKFGVTRRGSELACRQERVEANSDLRCLPDSVRDPAAANDFAKGDAANGRRNSVASRFAAVLARDAEVVRNFRVEDSGGHSDM